MLGLLQAQLTLAQLLNTTTHQFTPPLGQMISWHMQQWRFASFRFDRAAEPTHKVFRFIDRQQLTAHDWVIELRDADEAPTPICSQAQRLSAADLRHTQVPANTQRIVLACATGIRSWRAAEQLANHWQGEIALMAARLNEPL